MDPRGGGVDEVAHRTKRLVGMVRTVMYIRAAWRASGSDSMIVRSMRLA
jgi:hypothetical protein